ncbi:glutathione S-transferase [Ancylobacter sp. 3268]|uniref:glutathione S-transferase n=1 Tax=Ancylobacter sp. 3268 TaxID=2817752 RepID=UPI0028631FAC|nr:glutathione S-transferase [Ancylobacter sp. 3268]MDR6954809.1 glutathione S-transferase [Ancylobacter sp. 3268]
MADYELFYWPVPFRGQFIRALLAYAGKDWQEHDAGEIERLMNLEPADQPIGFMGPPVLIDTQSHLALSQMPSIALYLGDRLGLIADDPGLRAMTAKVVNDANDVIDEVTLDGGRQMWTEARWEQFLPRLGKWMAIWEAAAARHGVVDDGGYLLGTREAGVADIVTSTLWSTMGDRFPSLQTMLEATAPRTAALTRRMQATPSLAALRARSFEQYGQAYCGGEIEKSLRRVLGS